MRCPHTSPRYVLSGAGSTACARLHPTFPMMQQAVLCLKNMVLFAALMQHWTVWSRFCIILCLLGHS